MAPHHPTRPDDSAAASQLEDAPAVAADFYAALAGLAADLTDPGGLITAARRGLIAGQRVVLWSILQEVRAGTPWCEVAARLNRPVEDVRAEYEPLVLAWLADVNLPAPDGECRCPDGHSPTHRRRFGALLRRRAAR